jgi:hypothetical protein
MTLLRLYCGHSRTVASISVRTGDTWWGCRECKGNPDIRAGCELPVTRWYAGHGQYRPLLR